MESKRLRLFVCEEEAEGRAPKVRMPPATWPVQPQGPFDTVQPAETLQTASYDL